MSIYGETIGSSFVNNKIMPKNDIWYRVVHEILEQADIEVNGSCPFDIQVHHPLFYKRVLQQGSLGLGESYMDSWWDCERLDIFFNALLLLA